MVDLNMKPHVLKEYDISSLCTRCQNSVNSPIYCTKCRVITLWSERVDYVVGDDIIMCKKCKYSKNVQMLNHCIYCNELVGFRKNIQFYGPIKCSESEDMDEGHCI
jgi:hypothetical protein